MARSSPLVSVLTPVYNGERFLARAIESVLGQDYPNWEYIILNNCSTDRTAQIAREYSHCDSRIRLVSNNDEFLGVVENHNHAFRMISPKSAYTKIVSANDELVLPGALRRFVGFALAHPTAGIIGSLQRRNHQIRWQGLPPQISLLAGKEVCRLTFLEELNCFGNPTSTLYRSDLVRAAAPRFHPLSSFPAQGFVHADTAACFAQLKACDYGFIHEVLTLQNHHAGRTSVPLKKLNTALSADIDLLLAYGHDYLSQEEFDAQLAKLLERYYTYLGRSVFGFKGLKFWRFHKRQLEAIGYDFNPNRIAHSALSEARRELNPFFRPAGNS